jgi:hypothetical protein
MTFTSALLVWRSSCRVVALRGVVGRFEAVVPGGGVWPPGGVRVVCGMVEPGEVIATEGWLPCVLVTNGLRSVRGGGASP